MRYRLAACFRRVSKSIGAALRRDARYHLGFLLLCSGLGAAAVLAPFGVARVRHPASFENSAAVSSELPTVPLPPPGEAACKMLQERFRVLVDGQAEDLKRNYDIESEPGLWSWEREAARTEYLHAWAKDRGLKIIETKARIEVDGVSPESSGSVWVELTEHAQYTYAPGSSEGPAGEGEGAPSWTHTFGSRAVHVLELVLCGGEWKIRRDWYSDPIGEEYHLPPCKYPAIPEDPPGSDTAQVIEDGRPRENGKYDRQAAMEYAVRYAGVPVIEGSGKYSPDYRVYTFAGGDCANFASQVLLAGGLKQGYGWHYTSEGSASWVRGEDLIWHLLSTGRAEKLYSGTYAGAVKHTPEHPHGAVSLLEPGDLIGYETKGQICHVAVVVGKDPAGYVTIASHTSDRLFFPWDVGWNDNTVFWLIKITY
ncbi:MAG TPA: amidase domain-containing protein [Firmicutes bacterium]|nr:amidase domain-containing protein [Candidatus Fermentithermobacillaceae bacterium]